MDMHDKTKESQELDRVVDLISPRHPRECGFTFTAPKKRFSKRIWTISGVAALFIIVATIAFKSVMPVSAAEVIGSAISTLTDAESVKVEFVWRCVKTDAEEIYTPDPAGEMIDGTLYLSRRNGIVNTRIDWNDAERNSIVFDGKNYIHLRDNRLVNKHSSSFGNELMELFSHSSLPDVMKEESILSSDGNMIITESHKGDITLRGEFLKDSKRLVKASAKVAMPDGTDLTILETKSIETDVDIPETIFVE